MSSLRRPGAPVAPSARWGLSWVLHPRRREPIMYTLFLAPSLVLLVAFALVPALWAIYISLTNMSLVGAAAAHPHFVGVQNYVRLFQDTTFYHSLGLSLAYTALTNVGQFTIGIIAALLLSRRKLRGQDLLMAILVLPLVVPAVLQALAWISVLAPGDYGTLNRVLSVAHIPAVNWLHDAPLLSILLVNYWNNSGFAMILFLAGLENIPREILEAARVDGAGSWQMLTRIKLPLIRYVLLLWLLLNTIGCLGIFDLVYAMTQGGPGHATELVGIYIYNQGFKYLELGYGSAVSLVMFVVALLIGLAYIRVLRVEL